MSWLIEIPVKPNANFNHSLQEAALESIVDCFIMLIPHTDSFQFAWETGDSCHICKVNWFEEYCWNLYTGFDESFLG